ISLLVHVYSTEYMKGDIRFTYFYAALSLFTCGMLVLVTSAYTLQALFGWEAMGVCSFMLIGHWWEEQANSDAALKAFFTTRTGDVGLLVGIVVLYFGAHQTFNIATLNHMALAGQINHTVLLVGAIALFIGVIGKSAQFPLHTWLPDAMAGPTPVSALIHAATMVVAGVYLVARTYGVFWAAFSIGPGTHAHHGFNVLAIVGATTIIIAALLAFVQDDIKKVLAYSTVSQLGYMVMALACGAWVGGIFHLFTHAFFKACLFLGAGSVSHSGSHHSFDMKRDMGGLRKHMPITYVTFVIASIALAGIFPLAGFWSKDEILLNAGKNGYWWFTAVGLVGAFMTACYMARCVYLTFHGEYRGHGHPHESSPAITVPLIILAAMSVGAGWVNAFGAHYFADWTKNEVFVQAGIHDYKFSVSLASLSIGIALVGAAAGGFYYILKRMPLRGLTERVRLARAGFVLLDNKYYLDHLYTGGIVGGIKGPIATATYWVNQNVIDGLVNGIAKGSVVVAGFVYNGIDQLVVDGAVNEIGVGAEESGGLLRLMQTGRVQQYAAVLFGAAGLVALALILFVT
ncbi:MAG TPA: NADH-quinone oxidoreductase subunit L, partial [Acidimicrobiales bacterium]|nr:NADH-quinone oxidoreductase subunit L [Acidimicrobiales bacterium]